MALGDLSRALAQAQQLVPDYDQLRMNALAIQGARLQNQQAQQQMDAQQRSIAEQDAFKQWIIGLGANPTPDAYRQGAARFPQFSKGLADAASGLEANQRQQIVRDTGQIRAALAAKRPDLAKSIVQRHIDADKAAGRQPDPEDTALIGMIDSGDPDQLKAAQGMLYATLASFDPESAAKNTGEYAGGSEDKRYVVGRALVDNTGKALYRDPDPTQYKSVGAGETLVAVGGEGGGQASGGAGAANGSAAPSGRTQYGWTPRARNGGDNSDAAVDSKIAGMSRALGVSPTAPLDGLSNMQIAQALTMSEGGPGSIADRNNNPGNLRDPRTGAYRTFPTKQAGLQAAAAQVARNRARGQNTIATMVEGLPVGGGSSAAAAQGGARIVAQGAPKPGYQLLSPQENQSLGLDPNVRYQRAPDGQITALGGQSKAQLKPLPGKAADALVTNNSSLKNIDAAISLLDPKNQSRAAKNARYAIGTTNRLIPDYVLQNTNPEGVSFRAQIGQIGGLIIKDISGAAVSASEDDRLAKWVPLVTDTPSAALAKLRNLRRELAQKNETITSTYSEDQGYRLPQSQTRQQQPTGGFRILRVRPK